MPDNDNTTLCMGCMQPTDGQAQCPHCGYPAIGANPAEYLPVRTVLSGRYLIGRVLTVGGGEAVYMAYDQQLHSAIRVHEFCPGALCERAADGSIAPRGGSEQSFTDYLEKFLHRARGIAKMRDLPCTVPIYDIFEENGTAYTVEEPCDGVALEQRLTQIGGVARWEDMRPVVMSLLSTLSTFHAAGLYHLGINPSNIIVGRDGRLHLTEWYIPEARTVGSEIQPEMAAGYAAPEQYAFGAVCGAAADVYGITAVLFRMLTGQNPPERTAGRSEQSLMIPAEIARALPDQIKSALVHGLRVHEGQRTQTIDELYEQLATEPAVAMLKSEPAPAAPPPVKKSHSGLIAFIVVLLVLLILLGAGYGVLCMLYPQLNVFADRSAPSSKPVSTYTILSNVSSEPSEVLKDPYIVDNLVGENVYEMKEKQLSGNMVIDIVGMDFSDKRPRGTVISQEPAAYTKAERNSVIRVIVSLGSENMTVPDVSGWTAENARAYLEALGLRVSERLIEVSSFEKGTVQETSPAAGTQVLYGSKIMLVVSNVEQPKEEPAVPDAPQTPDTPANP
ncbi:MAG: PASTA domain-containing protein [Clostridia bacterium]|nr:PASTA domain-containing protein [Clostridia bacterium]